MEDFRVKNGFTLLVGDKRCKELIFSKAIAESIAKKNEITVIFDYTGEYYSSFGKGALLMDYISCGSVILDYIAPILNDNSFCGDINEIIENVFVKCFDVALKSRDSNDAFWLTNGKAAMKDYLKSLFYIFRYVSQKDPDDKSCFLAKIAPFSRDLNKLMGDLASGEWSKYHCNDREKNIVCELLADEAKREYGEWSEPFNNSLCNKKYSSSSNTHNLILQQMMGVYPNMFSAVDYSLRNHKIISSLPVCDMRSLKKPVFLCKSKNRGLDIISAAMILFSLSLIADRKINLIIPEIDRWQLFDPLNSLSEDRGENLSVFFGYASLRQVTYASDQPEQAFEKMQNISDRTVWCNSSDCLLKNLFARDVYGIEKRYELNELGSNCCVVVEDGDVEYCMLPEIKAQENTVVRKRFAMNKENSKGWISEDHALATKKSSKGDDEEDDNDCFKF